MIELRKVTDLSIPDIEKYRTEFLKYNEKIAGSFNLEKYENIYLWYIKVKEAETIPEEILKNQIPNIVRATQFLAYYDEDLVGMIFSKT